MKENSILDKKSKKFFKDFRLGVVFLYILLIILAIVCAAPFYVMIINATRSTSQINSGLSLLPGKYLIDNYIEMQDYQNIWIGFKNSIIVTVPSTLLAAYFGALTAYAFSKFNFKGKKILFAIALATMMVPIQLGLVGYYQLMRGLGLIDNLLSLILPSIANVSAMFFIKMYIDSNVDDSLLEAARIDGSNEFYTFNKIVLPIAMPAISTISILNFVAYWNNLLYPLILINSLSKFTLPVYVSRAAGSYNQYLGAQYLSVAIAVVPVIIFFIFVSRWIISGISEGATKG